MCGSNFYESDFTKFFPWVLPTIYLILYPSLWKLITHIHPFIVRYRFLQFLEIWFEKSGSASSDFFLVREKWLTRKKIRVCRTSFLEPLFYTFLEKWLQIKLPIAILYSQANFFFAFKVFMPSKQAPSKYAWVFKRALIKVTWLASNSNSTGKKM